MSTPGSFGRHQEYYTNIGCYGGYIQVSYDCVLEVECDTTVVSAGVIVTSTLWKSIVLGENSDEDSFIIKSRTWR